MKISGQSDGMSFSQAGSAISRKVSEQVSSAQDEGEKRDVLTRGFYEMLRSPETTIAERSLAYFGRVIGEDKDISSLSAGAAETAVLHVLLGGIPVADTIGGLISRVTLMAVQSQCSQGAVTFSMPGPDGEMLRLDGFKVILNNPEALESERAIAHLGATIDSKSIEANPELTALTQTALLTTIQNIGAINTPLAPAIVTATLDVAENVKGLSARSQAQLLHRGLYVILKQEGTSDYARALASFGMDIPELIGDDAALAAAKKGILNTISGAAQGKEDATADVVKAARELLRDDMAPAISRKILHSAFSSINSYCKGDAATDILSSMALSIDKQKGLTDTAARDTLLKLMDCLPGGKDAFEPTASNLAQKTGEMALPSLSAGDRAIILSSGLDAISKLQSASDREKMYAQLGADMGKGIADEISNTLSTAILDSILHPPADGRRDTDIVSGLTQAALDSGATPAEMSRVAGAAFEAILKDAAATENEKTIAQLGVAMGGSKDMSGEGSGKVRSHLFGMMKQKGQKAPIDGAALCSIAKNAIALTPEAADARMALRGAFEILTAYSRATQVEQMLGRLGVSIGGHGEMTDEPGLKVRMTILDALVNRQYPAGSPGVMIATLAKQAILNRGFSSGNERRALKGAFECIAAEPLASELERDIAKLADNMGGNSDMNNEPGAKVRAMLLDTLLHSSALTGSPASILAEAAKNAASSRLPMCDGRKALKGALDWIEQSPRSTAHDKALASLAINMGGHTEMTDDSAFRIRLALMDSFNQPVAPTDSRAGIFARLAIQASQEGLIWGDVRKALRGALEAMESDDTIADEIKKLARKGIDAGAVDSLTDEEGVRVRLKVMDEIIEIAMKEEEANRAALREELAGLNEKLQGDGSSDSVEVNDDFIVVDGVRIEVNKNSGGK